VTAAFVSRPSSGSDEDDTQPIGEDPNDPSACLAESIREMFDRYYSVSFGPPIDPDLAKAEALLDDFTRFWDAETTPGEPTSRPPDCSSASGRTAARSSPSSRRRRSCATSRPSRTSRRSAKSPQHRPEIRGVSVKSGSDGTRTRDLWRDRPAL
jgi:hypothetical protein